MGTAKHTNTTHTMLGTQADPGHSKLIRNEQASALNRTTQHQNTHTHPHTRPKIDEQRPTLTKRQDLVHKKVKPRPSTLVQLGSSNVSNETKRFTTATKLQQSSSSTSDPPSRCWPWQHSSIDKQSKVDMHGSTYFSYNVGLTKMIQPRRHQKFNRRRKNKQRNQGLSMCSIVL